MHRPTLNFLIDTLAFVAFAFLTTTGILTRYLLPPGSGRWATLWGLNRHEWGDLHFWVAVVLLGVLALHLILHWKWIICIVKGKRSDASGARVALGTVGLIGLMTLTATPLLAPVERIGEPRQASRLESEARAAQPATPDVGQGTDELAAEQTTVQAPPEAPTQTPLPESRPIPGSSAPSNEDIRGSMTLGEVARSTGIPLDRLVSGLGLPPNIDPDERIGRIRKRFDVSPDDVRGVVNSYLAGH